MVLTNEELRNKHLLHWPALITGDDVYGHTLMRAMSDPLLSDREHMKLETPPPPTILRLFFHLELIMCIRLNSTSGRSVKSGVAPFEGWKAMTAILESTLVFHTHQMSKIILSVLHISLKDGS